MGRNDVINLLPFLLFAATPDGLPPAVQAQLPAGRIVLSHARLATGSRRRTFHIVALGTQGEHRNDASDAPPRPLLIIELTLDGRAVIVGRNESVILRADDGGQCDPFTDGAGAITVKGVFFTVENGVACGQHWTDFVTFRFDRRMGAFVFDNERRESWSLNPSEADGADVMVRDRQPYVRRADRRRPVAFAQWRRR